MKRKLSLKRLGRGLKKGTKKQWKSTQNTPLGRAANGKHTKGYL